MRTFLFALTLALLTAALPVAGQHDHPEGEAYVVITHEVPDDGRTYVGNLNHFGWALFDEEGVPFVHHNAVVEVFLNGALFYATEPSSGHDYDGLHPVAVRFPVPGAYEVRVTVPNGDEELTASFNGTVHALDAVPVSIELDAPSDVGSGEPFTLTYHVAAANGTLVPHANVLLEVVDAQVGTVRSLHTHSHEAPQVVDLALEGPAPYALRLTAYQAFPSKSDVAFEPVTLTHTLNVHEGLPTPPGVPTEVPLTNRIDEGSSDGPYRLFATYDPYTSVTPWGRIRLGAIVVDDAGAPVPHVNFAARLLDPSGAQILNSATLHEYDGVFELAGAFWTLGDHTLELTATRGDWTGTVTHTFSVIPPVVATAAGPQFVELDGAGELAAGQAQDMVFRVHNGAGVPFMHGEVDLTVREAATGLPVVVDKLHTHSDGLFPFTLAFPAAGTYTIEAQPLPTTAAPTPLFFGPMPGSAPTFTVEVAEGPGFPSAPVDEPVETLDEEPEDGIPGLGALAVLVVAGFAAVGRRRR